MLLKPYRHLRGYLERWTVLKCGPLHIRLHRIIRDDATPFLHSHPFHYVSLILKGGYTEKLEDKIVERKKLSIAFRRDRTHHRIMSVKPNTMTLFFTWKTKTPWTIVPSGETIESWVNYETGIYKRVLWGKEYFCRFDQYWRVGKTTLEEAQATTRPSIDQTTPPMGN